MNQHFHAVRLLPARSNHAWRAVSSANLCFAGSCRSTEKSPKESS